MVKERKHALIAVPSRRLAVFGTLACGWAAPSPTGCSRKGVRCETRFSSLGVGDILLGMNTRRTW